MTAAPNAAETAPPPLPSTPPSTRLASFDCIGDSIILVYHRHHAARGGRKAPPPALQTISNAPTNTINTLNNHPIGLHHSWSEWGVERSLFGFIVAGNEPTSCEPPEPLQGTKATKQPRPTTKDNCSPHVHVVGQLFCVMVVLQFIS